MFNDLASTYKGKTVLITGDTGFKGSWLSIWLLNLEASIVGYSLPPKTRNDNYIQCGLDSKIRHIDGDIRDLESLQDVFSKYQPDIVFHLAAQPLVLESFNDPHYTFHTNIMGTVNLLEAVRRTQSVKAAVVITSDKCYENKEWIYGYREVDPLGGKDPYSASKGACEIIIASYIHSFFNTDLTPNIASVRAGNVIGGGDWCANRIMPDCIRALRDNKPITIRNPDATRPWQHVLDPLYGYLLLGSRLFKDGKNYAGPWNFGPYSKNMVSVKRLVEKTIERWGEGSYIIENSHGHQESNMLFLDISKAINKLNWYPVFNIDETIKLAIEEYRVDGFSSEEIYNQRISHIKHYYDKARSE